MLTSGYLDTTPPQAIQFRITKERYQYTEQGPRYDELRIRLFQGLDEESLSTPATRNADDREKRRKEDQHEVAQFILVHKPAEQTWDCVDRYINKKHRGKGIFTGIVRAGEDWVRSFSVKDDQKLTVDNIPQRSVLRSFIKLGYQPRSEEDTRNIARMESDSSLIEAYPTTSDGHELIDLDKCIFDPKALSNPDQRPVEKALFVKLEKIFPRNSPNVGEGQKHTQREIGGTLGAQ